MPYYQKFRKIVTRAFKMGSVEVTAISTDGTLAGNSDAYIPTQKAVKTYADALANAIDAMQYKGVIDCSGNPNYPAANAGYIYIISVAGKIGGGSGITVQVGDMIACKTDSSVTGDHATVGANWNIIQSHTGSLYTAETSVTDNAIPRYDSTTGTLIQKSLATIDDNGSIDIPTGQSYKINSTALAVGNITGAAPLAAPTFTGVPAAPTAAADTNTTQIATTAFVLAQAATVDPLMDGVAAAGTSKRYTPIDHVHPTDTTRAASTHNHDLDYLAIGGTAADSSLLETHNAAYFATATHDHDADYIAISLGAATGDMLYFDGAAWQVLTAGSSGDVLTINAEGLPVWA
jgi:hypothetical protein